MRFGEVAVYQGREYRPGLHDADFVELMSEDPGDIQRGFSVYRPGLLIKKVARAHLDAAYIARHRGIFHGHPVAIVAAKDGKLLLHTSSDRSDLGFEWAGHGSFEKWVYPSELERMWEERTPF